MFCPNCEAEYGPGIFLCADCHLPLVSGLPEKAVPAQAVPYVPVLATFKSADLIVIKSLLEDAGLDYHTEGENFHYLGYPMVQSVKLHVRADQVETARALLANQVLRDRAVSSDGDDDEDDRIG
ncbi:MAG: DUF2007 domain-containing protein [candidate division KSB1 bacterium]|nr:DUF2007 domain-containing protein [candidate division KSB1 bacterium]MDZ7275022.1 DUF2007 domain-containing protein [candidate division KSB1 bacterium]MDZ7286529.1 DUF2007 domain-containing protein [candidate division KSB1 bacterium]MDZ7299307.1 DUF2007 domain-containing protein [candidate division KSB1 bacterium]MDZ7306978.1 DUF2007 domain-containing protein [candidate division KSB1 bacterium]